MNADLGLDAVKQDSSPGLKKSQKFDRILQSQTKAQKAQSRSRSANRPNSLADRRKNIKEMKYAKKQELKRDDSKFRETHEEQLEQLEKIHETLNQQRL